MKRLLCSVMLALAFALLLPEVVLGDDIILPTLTGRYIFPSAYIHTNEDVWATTTSNFSRKTAGISVLTGTSLLTPTYYTVNHPTTPTLSSAYLYAPIAPNVYHSLHPNYTRVISVCRETKNIYVLHENSKWEGCENGDGKYIYCDGAYKKWENGNLVRVQVTPPEMNLYWSDWVGGSGYMCVKGAYPEHLCCTEIDREPDWKCISVRNLTEMAVNRSYVFFTTDNRTVQIYALPELTPTLSIETQGHIRNVVASDVLLGVGLNDKYLVYDLTVPTFTSVVTLTKEASFSYIYSDTIVAITALGLGIYRKGYTDWAFFPDGIPMATTYNDTVYWITHGCFAHNKNGVANATTNCLPENYYYYRFHNATENAFYLSDSDNATRVWYDSDSDKLVFRDVITGRPAMPFGIYEDCVFFLDGFRYPRVQCGITTTTVLTSWVTGFNLIQDNLLLGDRNGKWYWFRVTSPLSPTLIRQGQILADNYWESVTIYGLHLTPAGLLIRHGNNLTMLDDGGNKKWKLPNVSSYCISPRYGIFYKDHNENTFQVNVFTGQTRTLQTQIEGTIVNCNNKHLFSYTMSDFLVWEFTTRGLPYKIYLPVVMRGGTGE